LCRAAEILGQRISPELLPSVNAVEGVVAQMQQGAYEREKFPMIRTSLQRYAEMVQENFENAFSDSSLETAIQRLGRERGSPGFEHEKLFHEFCLTHGVTGAAAHYVSCMKRIARVLGHRLGPAQVRSENDVQEVSARLIAPELNDRHRSNFRSVLRKYVEMVRDNFRGAFEQVTSPAIDVDTNALPSRIKMEISRLVRDTAMARRLKNEYKGQCQICGKRLELSPNEFYVEAHHLKPLGQPHNGDDREENLVCVCPNCHVLLDYGALKIGPTTLKVSLHQVGKEFIDYHNDRCQK